MTAREFLKEMQALCNEIACKEKLLEAISSSMYKVNSSISGMPPATTPDPHSHEELYAKHMDAEREVNGLRKRKAELDGLLISAMNVLTKPEYVSVIQLRYLENMKWGAVADTLRFTVRYAHKLEAAAVSEMEKIDFKIRH